MAIIKTANGKGKYHDPNSKQDLINYVLNPCKTPHHFVGGCNIDLHDPVASMQMVSASFGKENGIQLHHFIISFDPHELSDYATANNIAMQFANYLGQRYQTIYAVHENERHVHFHIIMNSVSYIDGQKYYGSKKEFYAIKSYFQKVLRTIGIYRLDYISNIA